VWYNPNRLDEQTTGALCLSEAATLSQSVIVGKAPSMCGLASSAVRLGNGSAHGGLFVMTEKKCQVEGCERPYHCKGYCNSHYDKLRKTGSLEGRPRKQYPKTCTVEGCDNKYLALGFCKKHYQEFSRQTNPVSCKAEGCENPVHAREYCLTHYRYLIETGKLPLAYSPQNPICSIEGCNEKSAAKGYCNTHWLRWKKYGDPLALRRASWKFGVKTCKYPGCERRVHALEACSKHRTYYLKIEVFNHYGGKCTCCGEDRIEFLCLDHVNNDGYKHKRNGRRVGGNALYYSLIKNNFATDFELQILCQNCNAAKAGYGYCPHKRDGQKENN
jgi:hypothetical protein